MDALEHGNTVEETDEAVLWLGLPMAPSVLLQMVGPRVANHVLETLHEAYPGPLPALAHARRIRGGQGRDRRPRRRPPHRRGDQRGRARGDRRRGAAPARRGRGRRGGRRRRLPHPRRRLPVLPRRDHDAPRSDRDLGARRRKPARGVPRRRYARPAWLTTGASGSTSRHEEHAGGLLERLGERLGGEAAELAQRPRSRSGSRSRATTTRLRLRRDSPADAAKAQAVVEAELRAHGIEAKTSKVEHWLDDEERWDDEPPGETWEQEELDRGYAPWEVRVECASHERGPAARGAARDGGLQADPRIPVPDRRRREPRRTPRRWRPALHGEVAAGGELVSETAPSNPFAVFGGLGSAGTPIGRLVRR